MWYAPPLIGAIGLVVASGAVPVECAVVDSDDGVVMELELSGWTLVTGGAEDEVLAGDVATGAVGAVPVSSGVVGAVPVSSGVVGAVLVSSGVVGLVSVSSGVGP